MIIKKIGIIGAGTMGGGSGIAHLVAEKGFEVVLYGEEQRFLDNALERILSLIDRKIRSQKMTADEKEAVLKRITTTTKMEDFSPVDLMIEAIFDDLETRKSAIKRLDKICRKEIIFCSNTSDMSFSALASVTSRPDKVVGLNFMNPPQLTRHVEIIRGNHTSHETVVLVTEVVQALGKRPVVFLDEDLQINTEDIVSSEEVASEFGLGVHFPIGTSNLTMPN